MLSDIQQTLNAIMQEATLLKNYNEGKILITDDVIHNIPLVKFPEISNADCITIHELAKEVLQIAKEENNHDEVVITYSLEHEELKARNEQYKTIVKGSDKVTNVDSDTATYHLLNSTTNVMILNVHNHPSGSDFSMDDIMYFITHSTLKLMVLVPNDGGLYYMLKEREKYKRSENVMGFAQIVQDLAPHAWKNGSIDMTELTRIDMIDIAKEYMMCAKDFGVRHEFILEKERSIPHEQK